MNWLASSRHPSAAAWLQRLLRVCCWPGIWCWDSVWSHGGVITAGYHVMSHRHGGHGGDVLLL